jgi:predicted membrane channel-forming protein YqfA (hemolysin III family)
MISEYFVYTNISHLQTGYIIILKVFNAFQFEEMTVNAVSHYYGYILMLALECSPLLRK